jgi:ABC-type nitrate/sulfonate/bicarbonate transport system ATPase subunit
MVGLGRELHKRPSELSMGMRQRVSIARAFALRPKMLLLDEPFGMLDSITRVELQDVLLRIWSEEKRTLILVTHDVDEALFLSDRVVMMTRGPAARIGGILSIDLERPRQRSVLVDSSKYEALRNEVLAFLESNEPSAQAAANAA